MPELAGFYIISALQNMFVINGTLNDYFLEIWSKERGTV